MRRATIPNTIFVDLTSGYQSVTEGRGAFAEKVMRVYYKKGWMRGVDEKIVAAHVFKMVARQVGDVRQRFNAAPRHVIHVRLVFILKDPQT